MSIEENIENYAKWPDDKLMALAEESEEFKDIMERVTEYRDSVSEVVERKFSTVDESINYVKNHDSSKGEIRVYANGHWIYSINIAQEDYYKVILGHTRERQIEIEQRSIFSTNLWFERQKNDALENTERRKEEGIKLVDPEKQKMWIERVEDLTDYENNLYFNHEIDKTIEIMKILNEGNENCIDDSLNAMLNDYVLIDRLTFTVVKLVTIFSNKGTEFAEGYLKMLKEAKASKDVTSGVEDLIAHTNTANKLIKNGTEPEIVFNQYYQLYYMPIIFETGVINTYLIQKEEDLFEGTMEDNLVIVRTNDEYMDIKITVGEDIFSFKVPKGNKPVRVQEKCNNIPTGKKALIYFTKVNNATKALKQAATNNDIINNTKPAMLIKAYKNN